MKSYEWYQELKKPTWVPPARLFGLVWSFLYLLIIISFGYTGFLFFKGLIPFAVLLPFILNIIFNLIYTPIQFGLRNNFLAAIDVLLVLVTLIFALISIFPYAGWVSLINIPYLLWVCFATVLQLTITFLNK